MSPRPLARAVAAVTTAVLLVSLGPVAGVAARPVATVAAAPTPAASVTASRAQQREAARTVIVSVRPGASLPAALETTAALAGSSVDALGDRTYAVELPPGSDIASATAALRSAPGVEGVCRNVPVQLAGAAYPNDPLWSAASPLYLPLGQRVDLGARAQGFTYSVDLAPAWTRALGPGTDRLPPGRPGVKIGVVDTGYVFTAPTYDTTSAIVAGYDYADRDRDPTDYNPVDYGKRSHGTWVANVIRGQADNGYQTAGALGPLPGTVVVYKIFRDHPDPGTGVVSDLSMLIAGINGAADAGCKVINVSAGISHPLLTAAEITQMNKAVDYATAKGALVVCAAGNHSSVSPSTEVWWPAACPRAVAVSSIRPDVTSTPTPFSSTFSCYGPEVDACAPGEYVPAVGDNGEVSYVDGTSFSSPIVTAVAASLRGLMPAAGVETVRGALLTTAMHLGTGSAGSRNDLYGYGLVSGDAAWATLASAYVAQSQPSTITIAQQPGTRLVHLSWPAVTGNGTVYRYGVLGGDTRTTTALSAEVVLPEDGPADLRVEAVSDDHLAGTTATSSLVNALAGTAPLPVRHAEGADRYDTAVQVSRSSFPTSAPAIVIASGEDWPDALSAGPLARKLGAPLLLTRRSSLPYQTRDEIRRLVTGGPASVPVKIVGGTGAVSATVANQVSWAIGHSGPHTAAVDRVAGATRYETAARVADRLASSETTCVISSGVNWPDALAAGPVAAAASWPILLVPASGPPPASTSEAITTHAIRTALVAGGSGAVTTATMDALPLSAPAGQRWIRIAGADRYDTSRRMADWAADQGILAGGPLGLSTGADFPDGLAAGPAAARRSSPIVMGKDSPALVAPLLEWAGIRSSRFGSLDVYGGTGALPLTLQHRLEVALRPAP
jgi:putative cell wall-binding protein